MNRFCCTGRIVRDLAVRQGKRGTAFIKNVIAIDRSLSKEERADEDIQNADFIPFTIFGNAMKFLANNADKGTLISIEGKIKSYTYENEDGNLQTDIGIVVDQVEILEWE